MIVDLVHYNKQKSFTLVVDFVHYKPITMMSYGIGCNGNCAMNGEFIVQRWFMGNTVTVGIGYRNWNKVQCNLISVQCKLANDLHLEVLLF